MSTLLSIAYPAIAPFVKKIPKGSAHRLPATLRFSKIMGSLCIQNEDRDYTSTKKAAMRGQWPD